MSQPEDFPPVIENVGQFVEPPAHGEPISGINPATRRFWRPINISVVIPHGMTRPITVPSLAEVLEATDRELNQVAGLVGAFVAKHDWALVKLPDSADEKAPLHRRDEDNYRRLMIPSGHVLSAYVDLLEDTGPVSETSAARIDDTINSRYYAELDAAHDENALVSNDYHGIVLANADSDQFIIGRRGDSRPALWLVDIEPLLYWAP